MELLPDRGNVLIIADDVRAGRDLCQWVDEVGERSLLVTPQEALDLRTGTDDPVDLVITDLDATDWNQRRILERLMAGELLFGAPQLHLFRDPVASSELSGANPDVAAVAMDAPADEREFKSRVELGTEIGRLRRELSKVSISDPVTGCLNRWFILMRLDQEFARVRRHGEPLSLVLLEIDRLREINAIHGVAVGDEVIRHVARVIGRQVRSEDVYGRWGEKTFAAILYGAPYRGAAVFANKVRGDAEAVRVTLAEGVLEIRISAGISTFQDDVTRSPADLYQAAEQALEQARKRGGNRVHIDEAVLRGGRRLVLVADRDPDLVDLADDLLSMDDFHVLRADSTTSLLETLADCRPDLLVLDLEMADRGDGVALIEAIQELHPDGRLPIIGLSATGGPETECLSHMGLDRFITKPFSVSVLVSLARELSTRRAAAHAAGAV